MAGTTSPDNLPFPDAGDVPDGAQQLEDLAAATQVALTDLRTRITAIAPEGTAQVWGKDTGTADAATSTPTISEQTVEQAFGVTFNAAPVVVSSLVCAGSGKAVLHVIHSVTTTGYKYTLYNFGGSTTVNIHFHAIGTIA